MTTVLAAYIAALGLLGVPLYGYAQQGTTHAGVSAVYPGGCLVHVQTRRTWHFTSSSDYTISCPAAGSRAAAP